MEKIEITNKKRNLVLTRLTKTIEQLIDKNEQKTLMQDTNYVEHALPYFENKYP